MTINDIKQLGGIQPVRPQDIRPSASRGGATSDSTAPPKDRAELTGGVQQEARILDAARLVFDALPDVRADKVELAKKRLAEGYYDRPVVQEQIAARLAADPEARPEPPLSAERRAEIRNRLAEGFYDRPEIIDQIAQGLAEDAGG